MKSTCSRLLAFPLVLLLLMAVVACATKPQGSKGNWFTSWFKRQQVQGLDETAAKKAKEGMDYFRRGRFEMAEEIFQKVKDRYPFSPYATLAELRLADCKFYSGDYEAAIPLYQEFERLHPTNEAVPYAIFMEGTAYYRLMDTPDRDQSFTKKMIETYQRLLRRYPNNPYRLEAKRRIEEGRELLASHEMVVAKWYRRVGMAEQARYRLQYLLKRYPETRAAAMAKGLLPRVEKEVAAQEAEAARLAANGGKKAPWYLRFFDWIP